MEMNVKRGADSRQTLDNMANVSFFILLEENTGRIGDEKDKKAKRVVTLDDFIAHCFSPRNSPSNAEGGKISTKRARKRLEPYKRWDNGI